MLQNAIRYWRLLFHLAKWLRIENLIVHKCLYNSYDVKLVTAGSSLVHCKAFVSFILRQGRRFNHDDRREGMCNWCVSVCYFPLSSVVSLCHVMTCQQWMHYTTSAYIYKGTTPHHTCIINNNNNDSNNNKTLSFLSNKKPSLNGKKFVAD